MICGIQNVFCNTLYCDMSQMCLCACMRVLCVGRLVYVETVVTASDSDQHLRGPVRARQESVGQRHQVHGDITAGETTTE